MGYRNCRLPQLVILALMMGLAACNSSPASEETTTIATPAAPAAGSHIVVSDVWSRPTPDVRAETGITYMVLRNDGAEPDWLVASKTPVSATTELHEHVTDANGLMRMKRVDQGKIEIPAGETVTLEPGGLHVMLVDLLDPLQADQTFPMTLKFESGLELTVQVVVLDEDPEPGTLQSFEVDTEGEAS